MLRAAGQRGTSSDYLLLRGDGCVWRESQRSYVRGGGLWPEGEAASDLSIIFFSFVFFFSLCLQVCILMSFMLQTAVAPFEDGRPDRWLTSLKRF